MKKPTWEVVKTLEWESAIRAGVCKDGEHAPATPSDLLCPYVAYCRKCPAVAYERRTVKKVV